MEIAAIKCRIAEAQTAHCVIKRSASSGAFQRALRARKSWPLHGLLPCIEISRFRAKHVMMNSGGAFSNPRVVVGRNLGVEAKGDGEQGAGQGYFANRGSRDW